MLNCSEFEELEAVPTMAVMDGPLESTPSNAADVPEDPSFVNFFSVCFLEIIFFYMSMQHCHKNAANHILFSYFITSFLCEVQLL